MPTTDFETRLGQAMKALVPNEAEFSGPVTTQTSAPIDELAAGRARRRTRPAVLVVSGIGVAAAAAVVLVAVGGTGVDRAAPPAASSPTASSPTVAPSTAPVSACGAGLVPSSTPLALNGSADLPTSTPNGYDPVGSITVTLRNTAAACTLSRQPQMSMDSRQPGRFHLLVPASLLMAHPVTVPGGGKLRYRIEFRKTGPNPGEPANVVVQVGSAPSRATPFIRLTNSFTVAPVGQEYLGVSR